MKKPPRFLGWLNEIMLSFAILLRSGRIGLLQETKDRYRH